MEGIRRKLDEGRGGLRERKRVRMWDGERGGGKRERERNTEM